MHSPLYFLIATALLIVFCAAIPADHVVHEKREIPSTRWEKRDKLEPHTVLPVRIGLNQNNLENGYEYLIDISDPDSPNYGKHWTSEEVVAKFAPSEDTIKAVYAWLEASGINSNRIVHHDNKGWLSFDARTDELERLIHTEFYEYEREHPDKTLVSVGCDSYHLPMHIQPHIDYITPGVKMSAPLRKRHVALDACGADCFKHSKILPDEPIDDGDTEDLSTCDRITKPACIRALYQIPPPNYTKTHPNNTFGIYQSGDYYAQEDFNRFFHKYAPYIPNGTHPVLQSINGGRPRTDLKHAGIEVNIDYQLAYPLVYPQKILVYQVDDHYYATRPSLKVGIFNTFLDGLDGSYCNYSAFGETGDDPKLDPHYPDKHIKHGYKGQRQCGVYKPAKVISVSYGVEEDYLPEYYQKRQCNEYMKLGLQGTTFVWASGDSGVGGYGNRSHPTGCGGPHENRFSPTQPNGCYAILNVGGTEIARGNTVKDREVAVAEPRSQYYSSGGFSNIFGRPQYQDDAIKTYFKHHKPPYRSYAALGFKNLYNVHGRYNRIGRGIPDVSAIGTHYPVFIRGKEYRLGGTSGSAPIWAGIIARINEERLTRGKGPVGFINPVLYKHPEVLNDITKGNNPGCNTTGFDAVKGWDPVTGLGTPNYPRLLELFLSLP